MKIGGVDEAGRGSVLGPMVIAIVVINRDIEKKIHEIGVRDSKELSPTRRERLYNMILKLAEHVDYSIVKPQEIDYAIISGIKLTGLESRVTANLINKFCPEKVYIDSASINITSYSNLIKQWLRCDVDLICDYDADKKYPVVSAASIVAKVIRDREIKKLSMEYGEIGSGYPADPKTIKFIRKWLNEYGKLPDIVRKTWKTIKNMLKNHSLYSLNFFNKS